MFTKIQLVVAALALGLLTGPVALAQNLDTALQRVPADTAFFSTMLRNKEQVDAILQSNAWKKLWNLPLVQQGWAKIQEEIQKNRPLTAFLADPNNQELIALLADGASHEVFLSGGDNWVHVISLLQKVYAGAQWGNLRRGGNNDDMAQLQAVIDILAENRELIKIPDLLIGFKLTDTKRADRQIDRLEALLNGLAQQIPQAKGRLTREKIAGGTFLTAHLDGSLIPWDELPWQNFEDKKGMFGALIGKLKASTLDISLGVKDNYLLLSIASSTQPLAKFGTEANLGTREEFKPLAKHADRKITSIDYASKRIMDVALGNFEANDLVELLNPLLPHLPIAEEQKNRLVKDAGDLGKEIAAKEKILPGAHVGFSFQTPRGFESFSYDYSKNPDKAAPKTLTLLNHIGGNPILAIVGRSRVDGKDYAFFAKWMKIGWSHVDEAALANLDGDFKDKYTKIRDTFLPFMKRLNDITADGFIPALSDGQSGFVLDATWTSKQWLSQLPATDKAMPMPEFGILLGVSDAEKLEKAMGDYRKVLNDAIAALSKLDGLEALGFLRIPPPETQKVPGGTLYYYPIPPIAGLDERVAPTAGLSDKVACLSLSHDHAERMLKSTPLKISSGPLADTKRPLVGAVLFNGPQLIQAISPWVEFGVETYLTQMGNDEGKEDILKQVRTMLEVMTVFREATMAIYIEDGVVIAHAESVIRDLEKE